MPKKKRKKKRTKYLTQQSLMQNYGFTRSIIERFLPEPKLVFDPEKPEKAPVRKWKKSDVDAMLDSNPEIRKALEDKRRRKEERARRVLKRAQAADEYLQQFSPDDIIQQGKELSRRFVLHVGPTNSGKTYDAIQVLKTAESGVYLGPLRLLALEMFETLNADGCPCSLLTGEEYEPVSGAGLTASTIELCDFTRKYDVAVIDEAQLIADPFRGASWTNAICLVDAAVVQVCMAPEALPLIENLLKAMETPYEIVRHERLVPLEFAGVFKDIGDVEPGDALIAFSRKKVLGIAAALEKMGKHASVIYGALPPAARREEVRRFTEKETTIVVATDAIGMGISLPIKRVIFVETEKFDGSCRRSLLPSEIKQIAGRAGRFGKYDLGQVLTMNDRRLISEGLSMDVPPITKLNLAFPTEALEYDYPLDKLLSQWDALPSNPLYDRADMSESEQLLGVLGSSASLYPRELLYSLITCPVDVKNEKLVDYWYDCCEMILADAPLQRPEFAENTLESCELKYQAYDVYHQLSRRIGIEDDCLADKERLCGKINKFLVKSKTVFIRRCRICGAELPVTARFNICDRCFDRQRGLR